MIFINGVPIDQWAGRGLIYLATPYNHPNPETRERRFDLACRAASILMRAGIHLFCPIAHTHPIAEAGDLPKDWGFWREYDLKMLRGCTELWIVKLLGWDHSVGIKGEIEIAQDLGIPHVRIDPVDLGIEAW